MSVESTDARCYGCEHCGCDPSNPDDYCLVCDDCDEPWDLGWLERA